MTVHEQKKNNAKSLKSAEKNMLPHVYSNQKVNEIWNK